MEQLHELLTILTRGGDEQPLDTTVMVFRDRASYQPFTPLSNGVPKMVGGYFQPGDVNYITLQMTQEAEGQSVVLHEYVHLFIGRAMGEVAPWIGEGLAEYYSTFDTIDGGRTARLGRMLQDHLWTLQREILPLETLATVTHSSPYYNESAKTTVFYAQSWALIHYLQNGKKHEYAPKFGAFLDALHDGTPFATACTTVLGVTQEVLGKELERYAFAPILMSMNVRLPTKLSAIDRLPATPLPEAETHALLGDLLSLQPGRDDARAQFERAVAVQPTQPLALAALARLAAAAGKGAEAKTLATRPADAPTFLSEYYRADALDTLTRGAATADTGDAALGPIIEQALRAAIALHPSFAPAHELLSRRLGEDEDTRPEATLLIQKAIALAPLRQQYRLRWARLRLLDLDIKGARAILGPLAARANDDNVKMGARRYLAESARIEAEMASRAESNAAPAAFSAPPDREPRADPADVLDPDPPPDAPAPGSGTGVGGRGGTTGTTRRLPGPAAGAVPVLRLGLPGETRVFGTMAAIECTAGSVMIVASVAGEPLRVSAPALDRIEWISYRGGAPGSVGCGPQTPTPVSSPTGRVGPVVTRVTW